MSYSPTPFFKRWVEEETVGWHLGTDRKWAERLGEGGVDGPLSSNKGPQSSQPGTWWAGLQPPINPENPSMWETEHSTHSLGVESDTWAPWLSERKDQYSHLTRVPSLPCPGAALSKWREQRRNCQGEQSSKVTSGWSFCVKSRSNEHLLAADRSVSKHL